MADTTVHQATLKDLDVLAPLFDAYRQFYGRASDLPLARTFLHDRLLLAQSTVFLACGPQREALGFTQLYPTFSSTAAARTLVLNDLYVVPEARRRNVGRQLLKAAETYAQSQGAVRLNLVTDLENVQAQALYESTGWARLTHFHMYERTLGD